MKEKPAYVMHCRIGMLNLGHDPLFIKSLIEECNNPDDFEDTMTDLSNSMRASFRNNNGVFLKKYSIPKMKTLTTICVRTNMVQCCSNYGDVVSEVMANEDANEDLSDVEKKLVDFYRKLITDSIDNNLSYEENQERINKLFTNRNSQLTLKFDNDLWNHIDVEDFNDAYDDFQSKYNIKKFNFELIEYCSADYSAKIQHTI